MSRPPRTIPRKFSEKIALLNKKEAEANAEFEKIIKEVEETTRVSPIPLYQHTINVPHHHHHHHSNQHQQNHHQQQQQQGSSWSGNISYTNDQPTLESYHESSYHVPVHNESSQTLRQAPHHQPLMQSPSIQISSEVPNIEIIPINDDNDYRQQVNTVSTTTAITNSVHSTPPISSARSLPDIANLRVSSSSYDPLAPSYNDQRRPSAYEYNYDANSNILTADQAASAQTNYCTNQLQSHLLQESDSWNITTDYNQQPNDFHSLNVDRQNNYYAQQTQCRPNPITRANSTNAVLSSSWQNNYTLQAPRMNDHLSKSSEVCYGYTDRRLESGNWLEPNCLQHGQQQQQQPMPLSGHRVRSSSYNNIENMNRNHHFDARVQQCPPQPQPQQPQFFIEHTQQYSS